MRALRSVDDAQTFSDVGAPLPTNDCVGLPSLWADGRTAIRSAFADVLRRQLPKVQDMG